MKDKGKSAQFVAKPIFRILLYLTIIIVNLCAGMCLLFFQFTEYSLRGDLELLLPPLVVIIHTSTIGGIVWKTRQSPQMRKKLLWFIGGQWKSLTKQSKWISSSCLLLPPG